MTAVTTCEQRTGRVLNGPMGAWNFALDKVNEVCLY